MSFEYHLKTPFLDILLIFSNYVAVLSPKYKLLPIFVFIYLIINKSMSIHADLNRSSVFESKQIGGFCLDTMYPLLAQKGGSLRLRPKYKEKALVKFSFVQMFLN